MSAVDEIGRSSVPVSTRQAKKDKVEAARQAAGHALGIFTDAAQNLVVANALLGEAIDEDAAEVARLQDRINKAEDARRGNDAVLVRLEGLLNPAED